MVAVTELIWIVGFATTVTVANCVVLLQFKLVPTIPYTVVTFGLAITVLPNGEFRLFDGAHT